jgi:putative ABC transport system ATP-binding protein
MIRARAVDKSYRRPPNEISVLMGIDLEIARAESVALMGPSGSGKSTLLNLIAGIDVPTSGSILVAGQEITKLGERERTRWRARHIGMIFQLCNLIPVLTAAENVEIPLLLTNMSADKRRSHVEAALAMIGIAHRSRHRPGELSGGEQQRVAIARAIVMDADVLLADEPTGDLDAKSADETMDLLVRLSEEFGKTVVIVTHDPRVAKRASRLVYLDKGELRNRTS